MDTPSPATTTYVVKARPLNAPSTSMPRRTYSGGDRRIGGKKSRKQRGKFTACRGRRK